MLVRPAELACAVLRAQIMHAALCHTDEFTRGVGARVRARVHMFIRRRSG